MTVATGPMSTQPQMPAHITVTACEDREDCPVNGNPVTTVIPGSLLLRLVRTGMLTASKEVP